MKPIVPFEPVTSHTIPSTSEWVAQVKWDGVRILSYYDGKQMKLFNRSLNERTHTYPELQNLISQVDANSFILDGEVIALNERGQPSFHDVMRRDRLRNKNQIVKEMKGNPIFYMIFDVIFLNGEWINNLPLIERASRLQEFTTQNESIRIVPFHNDGEQLFELIKEKGMEGIVCKERHSTYKINGKNDSWKKVKNYLDISALVCGVTMKGNTINTFLLCLYDEDKTLHYIGSAGTGKIKANEITQMSKLITSLEKETPPPLKGNIDRKGVTWLFPKLLVKVTFLEWTGDKRLRQPVIQTFIEGEPEDCTFHQS